MRFEKISNEAWKNFVEENMGDAPDEVKAEVLATYDTIKIPRRATRGSAGYDFYAPFDIALLPGMTIVVPTGIKANMTDARVDSLGFIPVLQVYPRSSYGIKYHMSLTNTVGIIDCDYYNNTKNEGHILLSITNNLTFQGCPTKEVPDLVRGQRRVVLDMDADETKSRILQIPSGVAFAQGIFIDARLTEDDNPISEERVGGFGSTTTNQSEG
jgi:dUTP pyrophosphatase